MKTILITGVLGGMGKATAELLVKNGYNVIGVDVKDSCDLPITYYKVNLKEIIDIQKVYNDIKKSVNSLDAIVHFAGIYKMDSLVEMDESSFVGIFDINLFGIYRINKIFLPLLKKKGRIIITSSELAPLCPLPFTGIYAITKSAVEKYAFSLKMELQLLDVNVSVIRPGAVNTGLLNQSLLSMDELSKKTMLYKENVNKFKKIVNSVESKSVEPIKIAKKVSKILDVKTPKFIYNVNRNFLLRILNVLPTRFQLFVIKKILQK